MKYIVKNCPCYWHIGGDDGCDLDNMKACEDDADCSIKQIVKLCKIYKNMNAIATEDYARREVALKILDLLEIEEVDEK